MAQLERLDRVVEWINLGALLLLSGVIIFLVFVWSRANIPSSVDTSAVERRFSGYWKLLVAWSWAVAAVASLASLLLGTEERSLDLLELGLLGLLGAVAVPWSRAHPIEPPALPGMGSRRAESTRGGDALVSGLLALLILGLLLRAALAGHAKSSSPLVPNVAAALVHVTGAAVWLGGLVVLAVAALPALRGAEETERVNVMARVIPRFSNFALGAVLAVVASGAYSAWLEMRTLGAVTGSNYGLVLLAKLGAFLPALCLGAVNKLWTKPRILKAARGEAPPGAKPLLVLHRLVVIEVLLIAVVLALTTVLVGVSPPVRRLSGS